MSGARFEVSDRLCWGLLGVGMAVSSALILYLSRGTVFFIDELQRFTEIPTLTPREVIEPVNGHLGATSHIYFRALLEAFGADYLPFKILHLAVLLLAVGLFYALIKRAIGALPALAPALILLFLGSAWTHVLTPLGISSLFAVAMGLGALLALERDDRAGDVTACVLLCIAAATFSNWLAFLVGVAITVLLSRDRWSRAWIFLVPLGLYAAWWLWALSEPSSSESATRISNILLLPNYGADSGAVAVAAVTGLGYAFDPGSGDWFAIGRPLAALGLIALVIRLRRGSMPRSFWVAAGILITLWALGALAFGPGRAPEASRYVFPGVVGVLLLATAAARGVRFSTAGLAALFAVAAVALAANVALLRQGSHAFRLDYSANVRTTLAMVELARDRIDPELNPVRDIPQMIYNPFTAGAYLDAVDRYGSPAFTPAQVAAQPEGVREGADAFLASALGARLSPAPGGSRTGCMTVRPDGAGGATTVFELPPGGADLRVPDDAPAPVRIGRFGTVPSDRVGSIAPRAWTRLSIPTDASQTPWRAAVRARSATVCKPG